MKGNIIMNKKIIRLCQAAAVLLVCLALCSCTLFNSVTAYGLYSQAAEKLEKAGGYEADCRISFSMELMGEVYKTAINMNCKKNGDDAQCIEDVGGEKLITTRIGNTIYIDDGETGIKYSVSGDEDDDAAAIFGSADIPVLSKEVFENVEIIKNDDGTKSVSVDIDKETAEKFFSRIFTGSDDGSMDNISYTMVFNEKNDLKSIEIGCSVTVTDMGETSSSEISAVYTFVNLGEAPEITLNLNESEYEDGGEYQG